jgi:hypothetical protein
MFSGIMDPDPFVRGTDPDPYHTEMSRISNTGFGIDIVMPE